MKLQILILIQLSFYFVDCATIKNNDKNVDPKNFKLAKLILKYQQWASNSDIKEAEETLKLYYKQLLEEITLLRIQLETNMESTTTQPNFDQNHKIEDYFLRN